MNETPLEGNPTPSEYSGTLSSTSKVSTQKCKNCKSPDNVDECKCSALGRPFRTIWALFSEYCEHSTIHGVKYIGGRRRPFLERLWWIIIFAVSFYGCSSLILRAYEKWTRYAKVESVAQVCDANQLDIFRFGHNFTDVDIIKNLLEVAPPVNESLFSCKWRNSDETCKDLFIPVVTEEGICYSFNTLPRIRKPQSRLRFKNNIDSTICKRKVIWDLDNGYDFKEYADILSAYPRAVLGQGATAGLTVLMHMSDSDFDYMCRGPVQGFKILLHAPGELPLMSKRFIRTQTDTDVIVTVKPKMIITTEGLRNYSPEIRKCYFNHEKRLKHFEFYTEPNCELECLANYTLRKCGCVRFSMPRNESTKVCGVAKKSCYLQAEESLKTLKIKRIFSGFDECDCLPNCVSIEYDYETLDNEVDWSKLLHETKKERKRHSGSHFSRIIFSFNDEEFTTLKRSELYGPTEFFANFGGLLGLFMGISLLSVAEIIYFVTIRLIYKCKVEWKKKSKKRRKKKSPSMKCAKIPNRNDEDTF